MKKLHFKNNLTLSKELVLYISILTLVIVFLFSFFSYKIYYKSEIQKIEKQTNSFLTQLTIILEESIWDINKDTINAVIKDLVDTGYVDGIFIKTDFDKIFEYYKDGISRSEFEYYLSDIIIKEKRHKYNEISKKENLFRIYLSTSDLKEASKEILIRNMSMGITLVLAIIISINIIIAKILKEPLTDIIKATELLSSDKEYYQIPQVKQSDLNRVIMKFNSMADNVRDRETKIINARLFYKNIINHMPSALLVINKDYKIESYNKAFEKYFNTFIDTSKSIFKQSDFINNYKDVIDNFFQNQDSDLLKQINNQKYEKKIFNLFIYKIKNNHEDNVVIRIDDITEIENTHTQLRQSQKMETVGTLVSGISHDFNNILGGIIGTTSLMKLYVESENKLSKNNLLDDINTIQKTSKKAKDIISRLLRISRKEEVDFKHFDLQTAIENVLIICKNSFEKSVSIEHDFVDEDITVYGDSSQIQDVILNICINSYHAMTLMRGENEIKGGNLDIELSITKNSDFFKEIHPNANENRYAVISIQDTGIGISQDNLKKIFDPFFTTKPTSKGTGLGLSMVFNIIRSHNGFINVYSEVGQGTNFKIYLPINETKITINKQNIKKTNYIKGSGTILVVDDDDLIRKVATKMLKQCGYKILEANNGVEGINVFKKHKDIDLILLDLSMPNLSGHEAFEIFKDINPNVKIIISSGYKQDKRFTDLSKKYNTSFIGKPYEIYELSKVISKVIKN